ncbi:MAG: glycosyltransferase family 39 protein [Nitriliruptor sp.]
MTTDAAAGTPAPGSPTAGTRRRGPSTVLVLTAGLTFLTRFALAGKESYWLDELYAVHLYVTQPPSLRAAVASLAETSIHPPLYQVMLYGWIALFGDTEAATRTLSNVAVTAAVVALHRTVARLHGGRTADAVALLFSLSYIVTYYGLETRSYGVTLGLSAISTYLLVRCSEPMLRPGEAAGAPPTGPGRTWAVPAPWLLALSLVQLATLFVHYYNLFFWGAQAVFLVGFVLLHAPIRRVAEAARIVAALVAQLVVFAAVWGRVTLASFSTYQGEYAVEQAVTHTPASMLDQLVQPSFRTGLPAVLLVTLAAAIAAAGWWWRRRSVARPATDATHLDERRHAFGTAYAVTMVVGPTMLAYLAFLLLQQERFFDRYLIYVLPSVAVLLVLAVRELGLLVSERVAARRPAGDRRRFPDAATVALVVLLPTVVPGFVDAATYTKVDWRGVAADVAAVVASQPDDEFLVYETSSRHTPVIDHYFSALDSDVRVDATVRRIDERNARFPFEDDERIAAHDLLLVVFTHHLTSDYPRTLARLEAAYEVEHRRVDRDGRGYIIFDVDADG